jgi:hypothetical protein
MKDEKYYLHQTPFLLAEKIIDNIEWEEGENVLEPFKGEGAFYNQLPEYVNKSYAEIEEGIDFRDIDYDNIDTILTNPPFRLDDGKNAFFDILMFFAKTPVKRVIFLCSDYCFGSLTPSRLIKLNNEGLYIHSLTTCGVKKWRGRYYVITFKRQPNIFFNYFLENFE